MPTQQSATASRARFTAIRNGCKRVQNSPVVAVGEIVEEGKARGQRHGQHQAERPRQRPAQNAPLAGQDVAGCPAAWSAAVRDPAAAGCPGRSARRPTRSARRKRGSPPCPTKDSSPQRVGRPSAEVEKIEPSVPNCARKFNATASQSRPSTEPSRSTRQRMGSASQGRGSVSQEARARAVAGFGRRALVSSRDGGAGARSRPFVGGLGLADLLVGLVLPVASRVAAARHRKSQPTACVTASQPRKTGLSRIGSRAAVIQPASPNRRKKGTAPRPKYEPPRTSGPKARAATKPRVAAMALRRSWNTLDIHRPAARTDEERVQQTEPGQRGFTAGHAAGQHREHERRQ